MRSLLVVLLVGVMVGVVGFIVAARRRSPEPTWQPGLEFDPDFDLTADEIEADLRGESPHA